MTCFKGKFGFIATWDLIFIVLTIISNGNIIIVLTKLNSEILVMHKVMHWLKKKSEHEH